MKERSEFENIQQKDYQPQGMCEKCKSDLDNDATMEDESEVKFFGKPIFLDPNNPFSRGTAKQHDST